MRRDLTVNLGNLLLSLSEITDIANPDIARHQQRTAFIAYEIARNLHVDNGLLESIFSSALLHDIGAISVEEKVLIYDINDDIRHADYSLHCIRGEMILGKIPWFKDIAGIVRNHHTEWHEWNKRGRDIDEPDVLASQVIILADYIERAIDRKKYILHQSESIKKRVKTFLNTRFHEKVVGSFFEISRKEEFWLDLASNKLYPLLLHKGPYRNIDVDLNGIVLMSEIFRDIIDYKSPFTATHTTGVSACSEVLSEISGLTGLDTKLMKVAGNLHDIGKLIIPNSILEKPGRLTPEEFAVIKSHTYYSYYIINTIDGLQDVARWAAYHHEKLDGSGYPFRCKAEDIDIRSRIMTVADVFTAISEDRPYREGMKKEKIIKVISSMVDEKNLDKNVVEMLMDNYSYVDQYVRDKQFSSKEYYENEFMKVRSEVSNNL